MKAAGVKPNTITYSALIQAYKKSGQLKQAKAAFKQMQAAGM